VNILDALTTRRWLAAFKNGSDMTQSAIDDPSIFDVTSTVTGGEIQLPAAPAATDVWEFYIPYKV